MIHFRSSSIKSLSQEMKCTIRLLDDWRSPATSRCRGEGADYMLGMGLGGLYGWACAWRQGTHPGAY